jgi:tetratricopeptide (TPR) repeat protein
MAEEALHFYNSSLDLHGEHPVTHYNIGLCHHRRGNLDDAVVSFARCLSMDPEYAPAREWKERVESDLKNEVAPPGGVLTGGPGSIDPGMNPERMPTCRRRSG